MPTLLSFSHLTYLEPDRAVSHTTGGCDGRMELAQMYFHYIQPRSAWLKLKSLLSKDTRLTHLTKQKRRTFLSAEVNIIYQHLGQP